MPESTRNWAGVTGANEFMFAGWLKHENLNITEVPYRNPVDAANDAIAHDIGVKGEAAE